MHMSSLNELQKEVKEKKEDELVKKIQEDQPKQKYEMNDDD